MIRRLIECEFPGCEEREIEAADNSGWAMGWGHVRGFMLDGAARDLHLCPAHMAALGDWLKGVKNGVDRP